MTQTDRDRLVALKKAKDKKMTQPQAAEQLQMTERQVRRLLAKLRQVGDEAVLHGLRGRSNRKIKDGDKQKALKILAKDIYKGFGPTLASEYLAKKHKQVVSKETVRKWMREAGLWRARKQPVGEIHMWRARRERWGELVQWDTSTHDWLEGRGERIYLIKMIDDASSRLFARFCGATQRLRTWLSWKPICCVTSGRWSFTLTRPAFLSRRRRRTIRCERSRCRRRRSDAG